MSIAIIPLPSQQEAEEAAAKQVDLVGRLSGGAVDKSLRAYYREFRKVVEMSDVVLEVLDARDPLGCRCYQVEQAVMAAGSDKKLILVLNKIGQFKIDCDKASHTPHSTCTGCGSAHTLVFLIYLHYAVFPLLVGKYHAIYN